MRLLTASLAASLLLAGCGHLNGLVSPSTGVTAGVARTAAYDPGRVIVRFKPGRTSRARSLATRFGLSAVHSIAGLEVTVLAAAPGHSALSTLASLRADPDVAYAEPDYVVRTSAHGPEPVSVNDPKLDQQWGLTAIDAPKAWSLTMGSPDVVVAVLDTGVEVDHPDLRANLVPGITMFNGQAGPADSEGHGTHVAGIIAARADNAEGGAGVAPRCKLMPIKVMGPTGAEGKVEDIAAGLVWAVDHGARVVNMSLGEVGSSNLLRDAVGYALAKDVVMVAAMGNTDPQSAPEPHTMEYPAANPGVIAVGAIDHQLRLADFSFWGAWVSVVAPGVNIYSTYPRVDFLQAGRGNYRYDDGTSMAAPFVAGVAALVRSRYPGLSALEVRKRIENSATDLGPPGVDDHFGHGLVNAYRALSTP